MLFQCRLTYVIHFLCIFLGLVVVDVLALVSSRVALRDEESFEVPAGLVLEILLKIAFKFCKKCMGKRSNITIHYSDTSKQTTVYTLFMKRYDKTLEYLQRNPEHWVGLTGRPRIHIYTNT